jgi:hypothetical protein
LLACPRLADGAAVAGGWELAAKEANSVTNVLVLPSVTTPILPYQMAAPGYGRLVKNLAELLRRTGLLSVAQLTYFTRTPFYKTKGFFNYLPTQRTGWGGHFLT